MNKTILLAMNDLNETFLLEAAEIMGYLEGTKMKTKPKKTIRILLAVAAAVALLSVSAFALSGWYTETFILSEKPETNPMAQQALEDASRFTGTDADNAYISPVASYEYGDQGQSGVYRFSITSAEIGYYESGEIQMVDARFHGVENPTGLQKFEDPYENFFTDDQEMADYVTRLEETGPTVLDALQKDGWISGSSNGIAMVWVNDIYGTDTIFNGPTATVSILMADDTAYELWLNPQTLECEGFMFWKAMDMPNTRNGMFMAMKEGRMEQWQHDISNNPYALG